jgi:hypothetical protein
VYTGHKSTLPASPDVFVLASKSREFNRLGLCGDVLFSSCARVHVTLTVSPIRAAYRFNRANFAEVK